MLWLFITLVGSVSEITGYHRTEHYHRTVGIPRATEIREYEQRIMEGANKGLNNRIYNGYRTDHEHYPWLAGLLIYVGNAIESFCGGTLISSSRVSTAAHCVNTNVTPTYIQVVLGSDFLYYGGVRTDTDKFVVHPKWINDPTENFVDAAILYLQTPVTFNQTIKPVTLPKDYAVLTFVGFAAFVAGYGLIKDYPNPVYPDNDVNQGLEVKVMSNLECGMKEPVVICTSGEGRVGVCQGDSGSGLTVKICSEDIWIGIVRGVEKNQCELSYPSQYVRVTEILDFINENV